MGMRAQLERDHEKAVKRRAELASQAKTSTADEMKAKLVEALAAYDSKNSEFERTRSEGRIDELQSEKANTARWKGQWQKNALSAELSTLRAEFGKSSSST
ncbi:hypothetical protein T492DRAFT_866060 [Pavlovales sp. CCMP2436]|nr:hypothetical protein T492DRAFT_866060 [Pavlovales sp. CCMP2436]